MIDDEGPAASLPPYERLVCLIGRVCIADVWLEESLRQLFRTLAAGGPAESPRDFSPLLSECRLLLDGIESVERFGKTVIDAALRALIEANAAHLERNRIVHDMWLPAAGGPAVLPRAWDRIRSFKGYDVTSESKMIGDVGKALERLHCASIRVSSIVFTAPHWPAETRQLALEIVEGQFDLLPDGGYRPHSWELPDSGE